MKKNHQNIYYWGSNKSLITAEQTQVSQQPFRTLSIDIQLMQIACGQQHILLLSKQNRVYFLGKNSKGQFGNTQYNLEFKQPKPVPKLQSIRVKSIKCGWYHNVILTQNKQIYTWGEGQYGALGYHNSILTKDPRKLNFLWKDQDEVNKIYCGSRYTMVLTSKHKVYSFGNNDHFQLGLFQHKKYYFPELIETYSVIEQIACGISHTIFVTKQGKLMVCGSNVFGQLGLGHKNSVNRLTEINSNILYKSAFAGHHSCALTLDNELHVWGTGSFGQYLSPYKINDLKLQNIYMGTTYGIAEDYNHELYCWGSNVGGELGLKDFEPRATLCEVGINCQNIKSVGCGNGIVLLIDEPKNELKSHRKNGSTKRDYIQAYNETKNKQGLERRNLHLENIIDEQYNFNITPLNILETKNKSGRGTNRIQERTPIKNVKNERVQELEKRILELQTINAYLEKQNAEFRKNISKMEEIIEFTRDMSKAQKLEHQTYLRRFRLEHDQKIKSAVTEINHRLDKANAIIRQYQNQNKILSQKIKQLQQGIQGKSNRRQPLSMQDLNDIKAFDQFEINQLKSNYREEISNYKKLLSLKEKQIKRHLKNPQRGQNNTSMQMVISNDELQYFQLCIDESKEHLQTLKSIISHIIIIDE